MKNSEILINWNIPNEPIKQIYSSAWQIGDKYILKTGSNLNWLESNLLIIKALSNENIPVATVIRTIEGLEYVVKDNTYFFLSKKINGKHITDIYTEDYRELAYMIGEVIGRLHIAFRKCQNKISCYDNNFYEEIVGWVSKTFQDKNITSVSPHILKECVSELENIYPKLPRQLIHRDIHMGNMLFENNMLTGYIDFDLSQINARIFDLCYMSLSLLIDNINDTVKVEKWFDIVNNIVDGYNSIIPLTDDEKRAIPIMMMCIEMLFVAYFTDKNDIKCADGAATVLKWLWENKKRIIFK